MLLLGGTQSSNWTSLSPRKRECKAQQLDAFNRAAICVRTKAKYANQLDWINTNLCGKSTAKLEMQGKLINEQTQLKFISFFDIKQTFCRKFWLNIREEQCDISRFLDNWNFFPSAFEKSSFRTSFGARRKGRPFVLLPNRKKSIFIESKNEKQLYIMFSITNFEVPQWDVENVNGVESLLFRLKWQMENRFLKKKIFLVAQKQNVWNIYSSRESNFSRV